MRMSSPRSLPDLIQDEIQKASGWLGFETFMAMALYAPGLGYYSGERSPFGAEGDFVTAPALSPWYGHCLARQIIQVLDAIGSDTVLEFGAGDGRLASQILHHAHTVRRPIRYQIIELSAGLIKQQQDRIKREMPALSAQVSWLERLPAAGFRGVMLAHEVLDAIPVRLFVHRCHQQREVQWYERGLSLKAQVPTDPATQALVNPAADSGQLSVEARPSQSLPPWQFADRLCDPAWSVRLDALKSACQQQWQEDWPDGMVIEWHEQAHAWIRSLAGLLEQGLLLLVDYGFPAHEYYLPQREQGTLMTHRRHRAGIDVLADPGQQDLSVHVDFTAIARVALQSGMSLSGYCAQARFLMNTGLLDIAAPWTQTQGHLASTQAIAQLAGVQKLLSEAEMGELFKFMALSRGLEDLDLIGFRQGDRSGRLGLEPC
jgi:SAM-dependent MidA family methyltransferase